MTMVGGTGIIQHGIEHIQQEDRWDTLWPLHGEWLDITSHGMRRQTPHCSLHIAAVRCSSFMYYYVYNLRIISITPSIYTPLSCLCCTLYQAYLGTITMVIFPVAVEQAWIKLVGDFAVNVKSCVVVSVCIVSEELIINDPVGHKDWMWNILKWRVHRRRMFYNWRTRQDYIIKKKTNTLGQLMSAKSPTQT